MKDPPFCPNRTCQNYHDPPAKHWYVKNGFYLTNRSGQVQRYRCKQCGTGFSSATFSIDYCTKMHVSYTRIMSHLTTASGIRDIARVLQISCTTVTNRIARLARQSMAIHARLCADLILGEDLVADGFESFTYSQYFPNNIQLLVGKDSQFWLVSDYAHLRRKGRMTPFQKKKNEVMKAHATLNHVTIYRSFATLVKAAVDCHARSGKKMISLYTDEHRQYRRVIASLSDEERERLKHVCISSRKARTLTNPLFAVNYTDREIRKDCSDHTRETVQWAKNSANAMDRLAIYRLYHNYLKPYRINRSAGQDETHASTAGIMKERIRKELKTLYTRRRFLGKAVALGLSDLKVWCRCIATPMKLNADCLPRYAVQ